MIFFHVQKCREITRQLIASGFVTSNIVTSICHHIVEDILTTEEQIYNNALYRVCRAKKKYMCVSGFTTYPNFSRDPKLFITFLKNKKFLFPYLP